MEKKSGFTLIELMVVIAIMVVLSAYAVVRWPGTNINLNAQAQQLANEIRYTQSLAFSQGQHYTFNLTASSYSITDGSGNAVIDPVTGNNATSVSSGITITWTNLPNNFIVFNTGGIPYTDSAGTSALASNATVTLTQGGVTRTVLITPQTGRVIVQ